jgi:hypothetical protein
LTALRQGGKDLKGLEIHKNWGIITLLKGKIFSYGRWGDTIGP